MNGDGRRFLAGVMVGARATVRGGVAPASCRQKPAPFPFAGAKCRQDAGATGGGGVLPQDAVGTGARPCGANTTHRSYRTHKTYTALRAGFVLLVVLSFAPGAMAQTVNFVVVCNGTDCDSWTTDFPGVQVFPDPLDTASTNATALTEAVEAVYGDEALTTIFIRNGTWNAPAQTLDQDISILAVGDSPANADLNDPLDIQDITPDAPPTVVIQGGRSVPGNAGNPVFLVDGAEVLIDGVTLTDGEDGVLARGDAFLTLNRLYIRDNGANGVRVSGGAQAVVVNCSIVNNVADGILVDDDADGAEVDIKFCTILQNGGNGVFVNIRNSGSITHSVVYLNGPGTQSGAIVGGLHGEGPGLLVSDGFNYVYDNNTAPTGNASDQFPNYVNVAFGTNDVLQDIINGTAPDVPPGVDLSPPASGWIGEIPDSSSNLIDAGDPNFDFAGMPETQTDFDLEIRPFDFPGVIPDDPSQPSPDIGADEFGSNTTQFAFCVWEDCLVDPNPVGPLAAGELSVEILMQGFVSNAFIVPQGGDPDNVDHWIVLAGAARDEISGFSRFVGTNAAEIITVHLDNGDGEPSSGDLFSDGHAAVFVECLRLPGQVIGDDFAAAGPTAGPEAFDDGGLIRGNALFGRHFLIDTIDPRMFVSVPMTADFFVDSPNAGNGGYTTTLVPFPTATHPFPVPDGTFAQGSLDHPFDFGTITPEPSAGNGAHRFFNVSSISNDFAVENLLLNVMADFEDQDVHEFFDIEPDSDIDTDLFTGRTNRQPSGFVDPGATLDGTVEDILEGQIAEPDGPLAAEWVFDSGSDVPAVGADGVNYTLGAPFDAALTATDDGFISGDDFLPTAAQPAQTTTGIGVIWDFPGGILTTNETMHMETQFLARDAAGNVTDSEDLLDPLHMWWMLDTRARITPNLNGDEVSNPTFTFRIDRGFNVNALPAPFALFNYRVWGSDQECGVFEPVTGWLGSSEWLAGDNDLGFRFNLLDRVLLDWDVALDPGFWYLLVVVATDEAGNVQRWDSTGLPLPDGLGNIDLTECPELASPSWQKFILGLDCGIDTVIGTGAATFWHEPIDANMTPLDVVETGNPTFRGATIVPLPDNTNTEQVFVRFKIDVAVPEPSDLAGARVEWSLFREGVRLNLPPSSPLSPIEANGASTVFVTLPVDMETPIELKLGDQSNAKGSRVPISYNFQARTILEEYDPINNPNEPCLADTTPFNYRFVVVDDVASFIENKKLTDDQPIKIVEEQSR